MHLERLVEDGDASGQREVVADTMRSVDLRQKDWDAVVAILGRFGEVQEAYLFGSRVLGTARRGSDIDLAIRAPGMTATRWSDLVEAFEESSLPWTTDTVRLDELDPGPLSERIAQTGVSIPIGRGPAGGRV